MTSAKVIKHPGERGSHIKVTGVIIGNSEKNPEKVPEFCFVGVVRTNIFTPKPCTKSVD